MISLKAVFKTIIAFEIATFAVLGFAAAAQAQAEPPFYFGVGTHFAQGKGLLSENLSLMKQAGVNSLRDEIYWDGVETVKGQLRIPQMAYINTPLEQNVQPMLVLAYGNRNYDGGYPVSEEGTEAYIRYCEQVVTQYKGRVKIYEIWNEWGGIPAPKGNEATPARFAEIIAKVAPRLRAIDPGAILIAGWLDNDKWLDPFLKAGGIRYLDGYSSHPYSWGDGSNPRQRTPEASFERVRILEEKLSAHNGGKPFPIYITEVGWPTPIASKGSTYQQQADYLARMFLLARSLPYVKGLWWYDLQEDGRNFRDHEDNFGIIRMDWTPKPAYFALQTLGAILPTAEFAGRVETNDPDVWIQRWRDAKGAFFWTLWTSALDDLREVTLERPTATEEKLELIPVGRPGVQRAWGYRGLFDSPGNVLDPKILRLTLDRTPLIIRGDLATVRVKELTKRPFPERLRPAEKPVAVPTIGYARPLSGNAAVAWNQWIHNTDSASFPRMEMKDWQPFMDGAKRPEKSADLRLGYTPQSLYVMVNAPDPIHHEQDTGPNMWMGDSLQLALCDFGTGIPGPFTELTLALTRDGAKLYRQQGQHGEAEGLISDVPLMIERHGDTTVYLMAIPASLLGLKEFSTGGVLGFSAAINENDGNNRRGALCWGNGLVQGKDPLQFNWITFVP